MSRLVFVNRYFYPDFSATSQILSDLAFSLAADGYDVTVVTGRQTYTDAKASLAPREVVRGVQIVRVNTTHFGRTRLLGRAFDYISFYVAAFWTILRLLQRGDIVVAKTDPPLVSVVTALAARAKHATQINWLQDLFPEVAVVLRPDLFKGVIARLAKSARDWSLRCARVNVVLADRMRDRVRALGVPAERIAIVHNWTDDKTILPIARDDNPLRREWGLQDKFVVEYSGNLGRAHEFNTILDAAVRLRNDPRVVFLFIGGGAQLEDIRAFMVTHGLTNIVERPYQSRERLPLSLGVGDLHLVSLVPALEGFIVPSKFYGIAAAQRPIAFIGDAMLGEIARIVYRHECGQAFGIGDSDALAAFISELTSDPDRSSRLGRNARNALDAEWSQAKALQRWKDIIGNVRETEQLGSTRSAA